MIKIKYKLIIIFLIFLNIFSYNCFASEKQLQKYYLNINNKEKAKLNNLDYFLMGSFLVGQILNIGNVIYQQEIEQRKEINCLYGAHPKKEKIYLIKTLETIIVLGLPVLFPEHSKKILIPSNIIVYGVMINDNIKYGVKAKIKF